MVDVEHQHGGVRAGAVGHRADQLFEMREDVAAVVEPGQLVGQRQRQAAAVVLAQPVLQPLAADLGAHPRQQLVAVDRADQIVVGAEIEPLGQPRQLAVVGEQQDRQLARCLVRAPLRDQAQRVAVGHRQAGDDQLDAVVEHVAALRRSCRPHAPTRRPAPACRRCATRAKPLLLDAAGCAPARCLRSGRDRRSSGC